MNYYVEIYHYFLMKIEILNRFLNLTFNPLNSFSTKKYYCFDYFLCVFVWYFDLFRFSQMVYNGFVLIILFRGRFRENCLS